MTFLLIGAIVVPLIGVPVVYWFSLLLKHKAGYVASLLSLVLLAAILIAGAAGFSSSQGAYLELCSWLPLGTFGLCVDDLSLLILLIISMMFALISICSFP